MRGPLHAPRTIELLTVALVVIGCGSNKAPAHQTAEGRAELAAPLDCRTDAAGCRDQGLVHLRSHRPGRGAAEGIELLERSCAAGDLRGCTYLARVAIQGGPGPIAQDTARGLGQLADACERGEPEACQTAALFADGPERERLTRRTRSLFEEKCASGHADSCGLLALELEPDLVTVGHTGSAPAAKIRELLRKGCDGRDGRSGTFCFLQALLDPPAAGGGLGGHAGLGAAMARLDSRCRAENPVACDDLANLHTGLGDGVRATEYRRRACDLGDSLACEELATSCRERDDSACPELVDRLCRDGGDLRTCAVCLGIPRLCGVEPSGAVTVERLARACRQNIGDGCYWLARFGPEERRHELHVRACDHASGQACLELSRSEPRPERQTELRRRACLLGIREACDERLPSSR